MPASIAAVFAVQPLSNAIDQGAHDLVSLVVAACGIGFLSGWCLYRPIAACLGTIGAVVLCGIPHVENGFGAAVLVAPVWLSVVLGLTVFKRLKE